MAKNYESAVYSPYGGYELKARYQVNFAIATAIVVAAVGLILGTSWIIGQMGKEDYAAAPAVTIKTIAELGPPPTVARTKPQIQVAKPNVAAPKVGIPKPVADEEVVDDEVQLATREELAEIVAPDISASVGDGSNIIVDIDESEYLPAPDEFVPVEIYPEMIYQEQPEYPRLAKQAGITGTVWVKALVKTDGSVAEAIVGKSSGNQSLDEAATKAAYKNQFKPAIQNGRPIACWVTYRVDFTIKD